MVTDPSEPLEGGYYAVEGSDASDTTVFAIFKVLKVTDEGVHVRQYADHFEAIPVRPGVADLGIAVGHLPLSRAAFERMHPLLIHRGDVSEDELDGYRYWEDEAGGYWA